MNEDQRADLLTDLEDVVRKERVKAIPVPLCCPEARLVVSFSLLEIGPHWYIRTKERLGMEGGPWSVRVKVCPCCATVLPPVKLKENPPTPMTAVDDEDYCSACDERLGCCCYHPHAAYEVVVKREGLSTLERHAMIAALLASYTSP